jgi:hypothetical protein
MQSVQTPLEVTTVIAPTDYLVMALVMGQDVNLLGNVTFYYLQVFHNATYYLLSKQLYDFYYVIPLKVFNIYCHLRLKAIYTIFGCKSASIER